MGRRKVEVTAFPGKLILENICLLQVFSTSVLRSSLGSIQ